MSSYVVERIRTDDAEPFRLLRSEAFGDAPPGQAVLVPQSLPGITHWGAYAGDELVGVVAEHRLSSWFGGVEVATAAIASVAVAVEHRGGGLLGRMFEAMLADVAVGGVGVSTLFPTASGVYRSLGYELVSSHDLVEVPSSVTASLAPAPGVRLRRAGVDDVAAVDELYTAWAREQNGPLARRGPARDASAADRLARHTGITLAEDESGTPLGYAAWRRGQGYGPQAVLTVDDLVASTPDAHRALWRSLGSHASAVGTIRLVTSGADVARTFLPVSAWQVAHADPYMLRLVDPVVAFAGRRSPVALDVALAVAGDRVGALDGGYRLVGDGVRLTCERTEASGGPTYSPRGLALAFAGRQSSADLRRLGLLDGPNSHDLLLDAALGGRQLHIRDYF